MKKLVVIFMLLILFFILVNYSKYLDFGKERWGVSKKYVDEGIEDNNAANIVTSVVVNYRGFDTLGEVTVLFLAATGLAFFMSGISRRAKLRESSLIMRTSSKLLYPLILLFGIYIFIHGHLTPGGGFQGGAVIGTGVLLMLLAEVDFDINHGYNTVLETLGGLGFIICGLVGLVVAGSFLSNRVIPHGYWNRLASAGLIPVIYILIGIKVGSELSGIVANMIDRGKR